MEKERWNYIEKGDIVAYSEVYVFYFKKLYNYGRKFTDNTALIEDAVQTVLIMLWKNREKLADIYSPHSYLFYSFRNYIFKEKKRQKEIPFQTDSQEFAIDNLKIRNETSAELHNRLQKAFTSLTSRQKEAIFLRFYEALSFDEVAQVMNISVKSTYKLVARSLLKLKEVYSTV